MIRLTLILVAGLGLAMSNADRFSQPDESVGANADQNRDVTTTPLVTQAAAPNDMVIPASYTIEKTSSPAIVNAQRQPTEQLRGSKTSLLVPFGKPVVIDAKGHKVAASKPIAKQEIATLPIVEAAETSVPIVKYITATRVNVREGPSTGTSVLDQVAFAEAVEIVGTPQNGWVLIRIEGDGVEGYLAERFLQTENPLN